MTDAPAPCCEQCGRSTQARIVLLRQNISYFYARQEKNFCGRLCLGCLSKTYLQFSGTTLLLTWFGIVGAALGPCFIIMNTAEYLGALSGLAYGVIRGKTSSVTPD